MQQETKIIHPEKSHYLHADLLIQCIGIKKRREELIPYRNRIGWINLPPLSLKSLKHALGHSTKKYEKKTLLYKRVQCHNGN